MAGPTGVAAQLATVGRPFLHRDRGSLRREFSAVRDSQREGTRPVLSAAWLQDGRVAKTTGPPYEPE